MFTRVLGLFSLCVCKIIASCQCRKKTSGGGGGDDPNSSGLVLDNTNPMRIIA